MDKTILIYRHITVLPAGYGHKKISIITEGGDTLSAVTSNMPLTDQLQDEDDEKAEEAKQRLIELVLDSNDIEYDEVELY